MTVRRKSVIICLVARACFVYSKRREAGQFYEKSLIALKSHEMTCISVRKLLSYKGTVFERTDEMEKFIKWCVSILPKPLQKIYYKYEEKWLYLIFGVLTTVVSFASAGLAKFVLENAGGYGDKAVSDISTIFSWICAVTFAYITNKLWVFESNAKGLKNIAIEGGRFYGGRVFTLAVEWVMMRVGYAMIGINYWVMKVLANVVVLILNYIISKIFVFRGKKTQTAESADE